MGKSAEVYSVLKNATEPLTCREICKASNINESKSVASIIASYQKNGTVKEVGKKICQVTGHKAKAYSFNEKNVIPIVEKDKDKIEIQGNNRVIVITFDGNLVKVDSYIKESA